MQTYAVTVPEITIVAATRGIAALKPARASTKSFMQRFAAEPGRAE